MENMENLRQRYKRFQKEEEDEEREIQECFFRIQYMCDNCTEYDRDIWGLIEEQQEMLAGLRIRNSVNDCKK